MPGKDIEAGEEITVDYRLSAITDNRWDCACGCASCPGYFDHSFFALRRNTQRQYSPRSRDVLNIGRDGEQHQFKGQDMTRLDADRFLLSWSGCARRGA